MPSLKGLPACQTSHLLENPGELRGSPEVSEPSLPAAAWLKRPSFRWHPMPRRARHAPPATRHTPPVHSQHRALACRSPLATTTGLPAAHNRRYEAWYLRGQHILLPARCMHPVLRVVFSPCHTPITTSTINTAPR